MTLDSAFNQTANAAGYIPRADTEHCLAELDEWSRLGKAPVAILVGPSGAGKTLMLRILESRTRARLEPVYVPNPIFGPREMAIWALDSLTTPPEENQEAALLQFADDLRGRGSGVLLLIDDAELLPTPTEEWLLAKASEHMRIVFAVSDEAWSDRLETLAGDTGRRISLAGAMTGDETREFVLAELDRIEAPPRIRAIFDDATLEGVHARAEGIPVQVLNEAGMLLHEARAASQPEIESAPHDVDTSVSLARGIVSVGSADNDIGSAFGPTPGPTTAHAGEDHHRSRWVELGAAFAFGLAVAGLVAVLNTGDPQQTDAVLNTGDPQQTDAVLNTGDPQQTDAVLNTGDPQQIDAVLNTDDPQQTDAVLNTGDPQQIDAVLNTDDPQQTDAVLNTDDPQQTDAVEPTAAAAKLAEPTRTAAPQPSPPLAAVDVELPSVSTAPPATTRRADAEQPAAEATASAPEKVAPTIAPPATILVDVNAKPWGVVFMDGEQLGETPLAEIPMRTGRHDFAVRMPDGRWIEREIDIREDNRRLRFE